ncbi:cyclic lactone autoinducer peptide [Eubacterium ramulus]|uniref:cyclic lactone autoinducer peptide n=1 Tax=Eubacterium TaxID=1730 RepID=UPI00351F95B7
MSTKRKSKNMKQCIRNVLNAVLYVEANSSSSVMMYEPKTPKKLSNYRKER